MSNSIGCPYYRLTTVSVTDPVDDSVNDSVNDSVTEVVNYPLFLMYIERLYSHISIDRVLILDRPFNIKCTIIAQ